MDTSKLTNFQRQVRMNIRNLFLAATYAEMDACLHNYPDQFSKDCIREMMDEAECPVCDSMGTVSGANHTYGKRCLCNPK